MIQFENFTVSGDNGVCQNNPPHLRSEKWFCGGMGKLDLLSSVCFDIEVGLRLRYLQNFVNIIRK